MKKKDYTHQHLFWSIGKYLTVFRHILTGFFIPIGAYYTLNDRLSKVV